MLKTLSAFIPTLIDVAAFASPLRVIYMGHTSVQEGAFILAAPCPSQPRYGKTIAQRLLKTLEVELSSAVLRSDWSEGID